jgi:hypothetical protein
MSRGTGNRDALKQRRRDKRLLAHAQPVVNNLTTEFVIKGNYQKVRQVPRPKGGSK